MQAALRLSQLQAEYSAILFEHNIESCVAPDPKELQGGCEKNRISPEGHLQSPLQIPL